MISKGFRISRFRSRPETRPETFPLRSLALRELQGLRRGDLDRDLVIAGRAKAIVDGERRARSGERGAVLPLDGEVSGALAAEERHDRGRLQMRDRETVSGYAV